MTSKCVFRISTTDTASSQLVTNLLTELQGTTIKARTPIGDAVSFIVSSWQREEAGAFLVRFSPLIAERLSTLSGIELLQSARNIAGSTLPLPASEAEVMR